MATPSQQPSRRFFLSWLAGGLALVTPHWARGQNGLWLPNGSPALDDLALTPAQTMGPFYPETPIEQQLFGDTDLYQKIPGHEFAKGQPIWVKGNVKNSKGKPQVQAIVEVWQACATGRYHHSGDNRNPALLDNNFQFWGRAITGEQGEFAFKTIVPGKYPGRTGRHIHFRIVPANQQELVTQCYFSEFGEDNAQDGIYRQLDAAKRRLVTLEIEKPSDDKEPWTGDFQIVVK